MVAEYRLDDLELETLQALFERPSSDPMYLVYPVTTERQVGYLQQFVAHKIDIEKCDYFIDVEAGDEVGSEG